MLLLSFKRVAPVFMDHWGNNLGIRKMITFAGQYTFFPMLLFMGLDVSSYALFSHHTVEQFDHVATMASCSLNVMRQAQGLEKIWLKLLVDPMHSYAVDKKGSKCS